MSPRPKGKWLWSDERRAVEFWLKVDKQGPDECWLFTGHLDGKTRHGQVWNGVKIVGSHVFAYYLANGRYPAPGLVVRHLCNCPPCCNPAHLAEGTYKENHDDSVAAGTSSKPPLHRGETHPQAKLTDAQVKELRLRYTGVRGQKAALARQFGISKARVSQLLVRGHRP